MRLAIISRNKSSHSVRRLLTEAKRARVHCDVINPLECQLVVDSRNSRILTNAGPIEGYDAVLPRIGASITDYGLAVVKQFEVLGMFTVNGSQAIAESRDKMRCLQILTEAGLQTPATVLSRNTRMRRMAAEAVNGLPVVLKVLQGTQGVGVMLMHTQIALSSTIDTLRALGEDVMIQQFIAEGAGRDYRAFVIGGRVVAAMLRTAPEGEFRSNIHRGGEGKLVELPPSFARAAIRAAHRLKLEIAGVDLMESAKGPMILEVNSSPGFEGIEKATGLNIAREIIRHIKRTARAARRKPRNAKTRGERAGTARGARRASADGGGGPRR